MNIDIKKKLKLSKLYQRKNTDKPVFIKIKYLKFYYLFR